MTAEQITKTIEQYRDKLISQGANLEEICDEIDALIGDKLDEWLEG